MLKDVQDLLHQRLFSTVIRFAQVDSDDRDLRSHGVPLTSEISSDADPPKVASMPRMIERTAYSTVLAASPCSASRSVSMANVENVENPPIKPVSIPIRRNGADRQAFEPLDK
jgi:hypothetical protein